MAYHVFVETSGVGKHHILAWAVKLYKPRMIDAYMKANPGDKIVFDFGEYVSDHKIMSVVACVAKYQRLTVQDIINLSKYMDSGKLDECIKLANVDMKFATDLMEFAIENSYEQAFRQTQLVDVAADLMIAQIKSRNMNNAELEHVMKEMVGIGAYEVAYECSEMLRLRERDESKNTTSKRVDRTDADIDECCKILEEI